MEEKEKSYMAREQEDRRSWLRSRTGLVFLGFAAIGGYFLWTEHRAHVLQFLPYVLLLLCPLLHLLHGEHGSHSEQHKRDHGGEGK
jgi:hypothetical protein